MKFKMYGGSGHSTPLVRAKQLRGKCLHGLESLKTTFSTQCHFVSLFFCKTETCGHTVHNRSMDLIYLGLYCLQVTVTVRTRSRNFSNELCLLSFKPQKRFSTVTVLSPVVRGAQNTSQSRFGSNVLFMTKK